MRPSSVRSVVRSVSTYGSPRELLTVEECVSPQGARSSTVISSISPRPPEVLSDMPRITARSRKTEAGTVETVYRIESSRSGSVEVDGDLLDHSEEHGRLMTDGGRETAPICHYCGETYEPSTFLENSYLNDEEEHNLCSGCMTSVLMNDEVIEPLDEFTEEEPTDPADRS
jgi:hypothetical protein